MDKNETKYMNMNLFIHWKYTVCYDGDDFVDID